MAATISSEYTVLSFPYGSFDPLIDELKAVGNYYGEYIVPCSMLNLTDLISLYFSGIEIQVPVRDLVFQSSYYGCMLTFEEYDGPAALGQDILKSAYVVVDLDNKEVALAQATNSSSDMLSRMVAIATVSWRRSLPIRA